MKTKSIWLLMVLASMNCLQAQQHVVMQWSAIYDGPNHFFDVPEAAVLDNHANFYVTGYSDSKDPSGRRAITTIRYSASGQWALYERYDSTANGSEFGTSIAVDDSGVAYVAGISYPTSTTTEAVLIRYSPAGRIDWVAHCPVYVVYCQVVLDSAGSIYLGISAVSEILVWKFNRQGTVIDSVSINGDTTHLYLNALVPAASGSLFIVGESRVRSRTGRHYASTPHRRGNRQAERGL